MLKTRFISSAQKDPLLDCERTPYKPFFSTEERYHGDLPKDKIETAVRALIVDRRFQKEIMQYKNASFIIQNALAKTLPQLDDEDSLLKRHPAKGKFKTYLDAAIINDHDISDFDVQRAQRRLLIAYSHYLSHQEYLRRTSKNTGKAAARRHQKAAEKARKKAYRESERKIRAGFNC